MSASLQRTITLAFVLTLFACFSQAQTSANDNDNAIPMVTLLNETDPLATCNRAYGSSE
jgi:hypothetical protein